MARIATPAWAKAAGKQYSLAAYGHRASRRLYSRGTATKCWKARCGSVRTIIRQMCKELGVQILSGVLSREHVHMFVDIPPHVAVRDFARRVKGRSSQRSNLSRSARPPGPLDLARAPRKLIFSSRQMPPIDGFRNARQFCTESEADPD